MTDNFSQYKTRSQCITNGGIWQGGRCKDPLVVDLRRARLQSAGNAGITIGVVALHVAFYYGLVVLFFYLFQLFFGWFNEPITAVVDVNLLGWQHVFSNIMSPVLYSVNYVLWWQTVLITAGILAFIELIKDIILMAIS